MHTICRSQYVRMVSEIFYARPDDPINSVKKYSYEAHREIMEQIIESTLSDTLIHLDRDPSEPVYLVITHEGMEKSFQLARRLNDERLLYGLILVNVPIEEGSDHIRSIQWNISELHWYYDQAIPVSSRQYVDDWNVYESLRWVGLYGNAISAWNGLDIEVWPLEWLTIRSLNSDVDQRQNAITIWSTTLRVIDIETSRYCRFVNVPSHLYRRAEWLSITDRVHSEGMRYLKNPKGILHTIVSSNSSMIKSGDSWSSNDLLELDIVYTDNAHVTVSRFPSLETLKIYYPPSISYRHTIPTAWNRAPNLTTLHFYGNIIGRYNNRAFRRCKNVRELKISTDYSIKDDIYDLIHLETLIICDADIEVIERIDTTRFKSEVEIRYENIKNTSDEIINHMAEFEDEIDDNLMFQLTNALRSVE